MSRMRRSDSGVVGTAGLSTGIAGADAGRDVTGIRVVEAVRAPGIVDAVDEKESVDSTVEYDRGGAPSVAAVTLVTGGTVLTGGCVIDGLELVDGRAPVAAWVEACAGGRGG